MLPTVRETSNGVLKVFTGDHTAKAMEFKTLGRPEAALKVH